MKKLVIYDSFFGNTEKIAQAIGDALGEPGDIAVLRVGDVKPEQLMTLEVLVVGSPTRGFKATPAIYDLIKNIPSSDLEGVKAAAFDTRIDVAGVNNFILTPLVKIFGYAAEPIAQRLSKKGAALAVPPAGFIVEESEGPLREGELERAAAWTCQITV
jgi:flavodoxin I